MDALRLVCALLLMVLPGAAWGQVAAPSLNPFSIRTVGNPATLQWKDGSFAGAGLADGTLTQPTQTADLSAKLAQITLVGSRVSAGLSWLDNQLTISGLNADQTFSTVTLAARPTDALALGIALERQSFEVPVQTDTQKLPIVGVSLRLGDAIYLGAAAGRESRVLDQVGPPLVHFDLRRGVNRFGIGAYWGGPGGALHLEAFRETRQDYEFPAPIGPMDGFRGSWLVAEGRIGSAMISANSGTETDLSGSNPNTKRSSQWVLAWAPRAGLSASVIVLREKTDDAAGVFVEEVKVTAVGLGLRF